MSVLTTLELQINRKAENLIFRIQNDFLFFYYKL